MRAPKQIEHILTVTGKPERLRLFKRIAYISPKNPLYFPNILPVDDYGDKELWFLACKLNFGVSRVPGHARVLDEEEGRVVYAFRTDRNCNLNFMPFSFPDLNFELYLPSADKYLVLKKELFQINNYIYKHSKPSIPEELIHLLKTAKRKSVALVINHCLGNFDPDFLPYDLIIYIGTDFGYPFKTIMSEKVIRIKAEPASILRWLSEFNLKLNCLIDIDEYCHRDSFFQMLSPLLSDESWYFSNRLYEVNLKELSDNINSNNYGFPALNFYANPLNQDEEPFKSEYIRNAIRDLPSDDLPPEAFEGEQPQFITHKLPVRVSVIYKLNRRPPMTEIRCTENVDVRISNASVWDFENDFNCIVPDSSWNIQDFLPLSKEVDFILNIDWFRRRSFEKFLEEAFLEKWKCIGIGIDLEQDFVKAFRILKKWNKKYPEKVHFFLMDPERKKNVSFLLHECFDQK